MKYSIQNPYGEVYGMTNLPISTLSPHDWESELEVELRSVPVIEVKSAALEINGEQVDRIAITIDPTADGIETNRRLDRIENIIGLVALTHQLPS